MRALAYEGRRLLAIRSTWLILATAVLVQAAVTVLLAHRAGPAELRMPQLVRTLTTTLPLLPVPLAGLTAGLLGALAADHEVRQPGLAASQVRYLTRMRLLLAKLGMVGAVAAVLAAVSLLVDAVIVRLVRPSTAYVLTVGEVGNIGQPQANHWRLSVLLAFTAVVVAAGWLGLLAAAVSRSAVVGFLLFCALPMLVEVVADMPLLRRLGDAGLPLVAQMAHLTRTARVPWTESASVPLDVLDPIAQPVPVLGSLLLPVSLLLILCLLLQVRRRSF
ncbi:hypothetical protein LN042_19410 [Kitasatospora sp. RB6PN24]|uniref:hypothetical protein n=1 Tax=Kitasatospora humi TaxID=2893891 RepID=UPI001E411FF2|nr:hypothetical protein [Kitasatospora humi]MCC9309226.1 hypothetical protein [Kitasatospora humi]